MPFSWNPFDIFSCFRSPQIVDLPFEKPCPICYDMKQRWRYLECCEHSFCADCAMRGAPSPVLGAGLNVSGLTYRLFSQTRRGPARTSVSTSA